MANLDLTTRFDFADVNGIRLHYAEQGSGPLVVLVHGFPECWYSWRHQLAALAEAGYRAVAPDMRGYGKSSAPAEIEAYSILELTADVAGLISALGADQAHVVGHDWGAPVAWHTALLHPGLVRSITGLSVPHRKRAKADPIELLEQIYAGRFFYQLYFQEPGVAEAELDADARTTLRKILYGISGEAMRDGFLAERPRDSRLLDALEDPAVLPPWLGEADLDVYVGEFERTGFRGGLNWYRNIARNWQLMAAHQDAVVEQPALYVAGARDVVLRMYGTVPPDEVMAETVRDLRDCVVLEDCGHWTQQERPDAVNRALLELFDSV